MTAKRRKRKPKLKQHPKQHPELEKLAETQVESREDASPIEIEVEVESLSTEPLSELEASPSQFSIPPEAERPTPDVTAQAAADRRKHPRYAFKATAELVGSEPAERLRMRTRDLSQQGCYLDTNNPLDLGTVIRVRISKSTSSMEASARVVSRKPGQGMGVMFVAIEPEQHTTLSGWIAESRETSWLAANRRRSQRVLMRIPVRVSGRVGAGSIIEEETHTLAVSAHGALIVVGASVHRGQRVVLSNMQTQAEVECDVVHVERILGEHFQVGVEFLLPNPKFWHVSFPPGDWTPRHPDAKSR